MAENETGQEKTEDPTSRRLERAKEEGQIPKSQEVNTALILMAGVASFYFFGAHMVRSHLENIEYYFNLSALYRIGPENYHAILLEVGLRVLTIIVPFFIIFVIVAIVINVAQVGFVLVGKPLKPTLNKINPYNGIKRILGNRGRIELLKSIAKIFLIAPVMIWLITRNLPGLMNLAITEPPAIIEHIAWLALEIAIYALAIMLILALLDLWFQRWQHHQDMKMTKEEVRQEMKDVQGDPKIKSRIRSIQLEMARKRMMEGVPEAEVVVTNPTEYAIALKYDSEENAAPIVVAKGRNHLARRIKDIAIENGVPIVENRPLAQSLYRLVEVGQFIPPELYQAVAEVLAYVYRLTKRTA